MVLNHDDDSLVIEYRGANSSSPPSVAVNELFSPVSRSGYYGPFASHFRNGMPDRSQSFGFTTV